VTADGHDIARGKIELIPQKLSTGAFETAQNSGEAHIAAALMA